VVSVEEPVSTDETEVEGFCPAAPDERVSALPQPTASTRLIAVSVIAIQPQMRIGLPRVHRAHRPLSSDAHAATEVLGESRPKGVHDSLRVTSVRT
jgi:hypothetical protein